MALRDSQDVLIFEDQVTSGHLRVSQDALVFEAQQISGHLRVSQDALIFEIPIIPTPCVPLVNGKLVNGAYFPDLQLYIGPATALYKTPVPASQITSSESTSQGRNAIILDFNNTEGLYARDFETVFTWPLGVGTVLDIWQPSVVPSQDELYNRLSYHFLMTSLGMEGWGTIRELNLAHNASSDLTLLLTFDQWPPITLTIPNSGGVETKVKITVPVNKFKLVEGFVSSGQPFMLWVSDCEMKVGQWGRTESYRLVRPFV